MIDFCLFSVVSSESSVEKLPGCRDVTIGVVTGRRYMRMRVVIGRHILGCYYVLC